MLETRAGATFTPNSDKYVFGKRVGAAFTKISRHSTRARNARGSNIRLKSAQKVSSKGLKSLRQRRKAAPGTPRGHFCVNRETAGRLHGVCRDLQGPARNFTRLEKALLRNAITRSGHTRLQKCVITFEQGAVDPWPRRNVRST